MDAIFTAVDMTTAAAFVGAIGLVAVGVAMTFRGIGLSRKGVGQVR